MLPIIVAGSRPAAVALAQKRPFNCNTSVELHRLRLVHVNITETGRSRLPFSSTVLLNPIGSHPLPHAQQPNRHRARGTASRIHSRDFLPWRFSNAGPQPRSSRRRPSSAGIRKPSQQRPFDGWVRLSAKVESPGGISPPGAPRTVREPLDSHGSRCSAVAMP
jgi:hypothetical protein